MKDPREDQLLCPKCYVPVTSLTIRKIDIYTCGLCEQNYVRASLVSANELSDLIHEGIVER